MSDETVTSEEVALDVKFGTLSSGEYTMSLGVEVPKKALSLEKFDVLLSGSRLRVRILGNGHGQDPSQLLIDGTYDKIESEVDSKRYSVKIDAVGFRLTFSKDGVDHSKVDALVKKFGKLFLQRVGKAHLLESKKATQQAASQAHPDVEVGVGRPHGTPVLNELARMMRERGKDPGWKIGITQLIKENLKKHCAEQNVEYKKEGMTADQIDKLQSYFGDSGELMVAKLEKCIGKDDLWYRKITGFGLGKADALGNAIVVFRRCYPIPDSEDDRSDVDIANLMTPEGGNPAETSSDSVIDSYRAAVQEGMGARADDVAKDQCPYTDQDSPQYKGWINGWDKVDEQDSFRNGVDESGAPEDILTQGGEEGDDPNQDQEDLEDEEDDDEE